MIKLLICFVFCFISANQSHAQSTLPTRQESSAQTLIKGLNNRYNSLETALNKLEKDLGTFPSTLLILSLVKRYKSDIRLLSIEVWDGEKYLSSHIYSTDENNALSAGGRHELYFKETEYGNHEIKLIYYWTEGDAAPRKGEAVISLNIKKSEECFVELSLEKKGNSAVLTPARIAANN